MTWFRVGGAGIPASLKNNMNSVLNKKFGTTGQNYPPNRWPDDVNLLGPLPEKTVAGANAHTDDAADTVPVKSLICSIVPKQAGSGTPSPTNVRALSGYTGLTASQRGKNLFDKDDANVVDGYIDVSSFNANNVRAKTIYIPIKGGVTYTVSKTVGAQFSIATSSNIPSAGATYTSRQAGNTSSSLTITAGTNDLYLWAWVFLEGTDTGTLQEMIDSVQIEVGSSASSFEAYNAAADVSDSWSSIGAILGGERNLTTGVLRVTYSLVNFSDLTWQPQTASGRNFFLASVTGMENTNNTGALSDMIDYVGNVTVAAMTDPSMAKWFGTLRIYDTSCSDVTALSAKYGSAKILIPLATPIEYTNLSTYDFETLYAVNNFYSDIEGGQTQLTYRQDIALALQAVSSSRGLMMASRPVTQLVGEESDPDQVNELVENDETEQEGENNAR